MVKELENINKVLAKRLLDDKCALTDVTIGCDWGFYDNETITCKIEAPLKDRDDDFIDALRYCYEDIKETDKLSKICCGRGQGKRLYQEQLLKDRFIPKVEKVIFNDPATIVLWSDGTKTVVKCAVTTSYKINDIGEMEKEQTYEFDKEKGLAMAIAKKFLGTNKSGSNYYDVFKKWIFEDKTETKNETEEVTLYADGIAIVKEKLDKELKEAGEKLIEATHKIKEQLGDD